MAMLIHPEDNHMVQYFKQRARCNTQCKTDTDRKVSQWAWSFNSFATDGTFEYRFEKFSFGREGVSRYL